METIICVKNFKFVSLMFVTLGLGSQIPLLRAIFHGLGTQTQGDKPWGLKGTKDNSPKTIQNNLVAYIKK